MVIRLKKLINKYLKMVYMQIKYQMIMKKIVIILLLILVYNCSNHLDKSINEQLTIDELKKSMEKDSTFEEIYKTIQLIKELALRTDIEKAKFADLTYNRVIKFIKFSQDTLYFKPIRERLKEEWQEKYGVLINKVDSISNYWKKYREENSLEQYVKIELVKIDKEYYSYINEVKNIYLGFRLTPLKGQIDQLKFRYKFVYKIDNNDKLNNYTPFSSSLDNSYCSTASPFSKPTIRYWEATFTDQMILENYTLETLFKKYNLYIEIIEIQKDGKVINKDDLAIPVSVKNYWYYENNENLKDIYIKDILKEILKIDYISESEFISTEINKILKKKDPLAFEFLNISNKI